MIDYKDKIIDAFLIQVMQTPVSLITNNQIIEAANVSRATFYKHFSSKEDIILYYGYRFNKKITKIFKNNIRKKYNGKVNLEAFTDICVNDVVPIVYRERDRFRILMSSSLRGIWNSYLEEHYIRVLNKLFPDADKFNVIVYVKNIVTILTVWMDSFIPIPEEDFKQFVLTMFDTKLKDIFTKQPYDRLLRNIN